MQEDTERDRNFAVTVKPWLDPDLVTAPKSAYKQIASNDDPYYDAVGPRIPTCHFCALNC